ncbi:zinc finger protein 277 isoform X2 [Narcine bancroftii]|uniref:zinc finger protein 277 isoform X2 n=1 Tax=Narcine bancroftii TaxID=1343680 RepID=UPI003831B6E1
MAAVGVGEGENKDWILEPLSLPEPIHKAVQDSTSPLLPCIFCEECYPAEEKENLLKHMILEHKLVISDVKLIVDFRRYILYWKKRFTEQPLADFCSVIRTNSQAMEEKQEDYYLLCDVLPEDRVLREQLQQKRLEEVLEQQQLERNDSNFYHICLFCNGEFSGNRAVLFNHMAKEHAFNVGLPDNIVYCNEFLDLVQKKVDSLQCLYCEKTFRDKNTLRDHMRKKQHRRINAKNQEYDRFYTINYLEFGKNWEEVQSEDDSEIIEEPDDDWSDWQGNPTCAVCLFCEKAKDSTEKLHLHMKTAHCFDLLKLKSEMGLNFYQQVKLINFIRREIYQRRCFRCGETFNSKAEIVNHMTETDHIMSLLDRSAWDQPQLDRRNKEIILY